MDVDLRPIPDSKARKKIAARIRDGARQISRDRSQHAEQVRNADLDDPLKETGEWVAAWGTFTKGLHHNGFGQVRGNDLRKLIEALNQAPEAQELADDSPFPGVCQGAGAGLPAVFDAPLYNGGFKRPQAGEQNRARGWESPLAGHVFDLEGVDADQAILPPAPEIGSPELTMEMAEVYFGALLRDKPFATWQEDPDIEAAVSELGKLSFFQDNTELDAAAVKRRKARSGKTGFALDVFLRGSTNGAKTGPYLSQFLLLGNDERPSSPEKTEWPDSEVDSELDASVSTRNRSGTIGRPAAMSDGLIRYGIQTISQSFRGYADGLDHMTEWATWLDVQNGSNRKDKFDRYNDIPRFISTPRDLATYVHFDTLCQAYVNAVLILLGQGADTDVGLPEGKGNPERDAFATFGGPHILTLVSEVAARALRAVRRQKYNIHLRARPEAVAAALSLAWTGGAAEARLGNQGTKLSAMTQELKKIGLLERLRAHNRQMNEDIWSKQYGSVDLGPLTAKTNALLPMAYPEGSPMHPAYGSCHAAVAGACVTAIKAFFEMYECNFTRGSFSIYEFVNRERGFPAIRCPEELFGKEVLLLGDRPPFEPDPDTEGRSLREVNSSPVSLQGELDKLAANMSLGRSFAGVHYYSDYFESLRMGERIAISILQEQMLTYREPVFMRLTSFDGDRLLLAGTGGCRGTADSLVYVWDKTGKGGDAKSLSNWLQRHA